MKLLCASALLIAGVVAASAAPLQMSGLGNGQGWNDGGYYTGYVTLNYAGVDYAALCIDALHDTYGTSWDAVYVPLTDSAGTAAVMQAYFGLSDSSDYMAKLFADMLGWELLSDTRLTLAANNRIQHDVWAQFAPTRYNDTDNLFNQAQNEIPNGQGEIEIGDGRTIQVDLNRFGLLVDANYASSGSPEQLFLIEPPPGVPEPASLFLAGTALLGLGLARRRRAFGR